MKDYLWMIQRQVKNSNETPLRGVNGYLDPTTSNQHQLKHLSMELTAVLIPRLEICSNHRLPRGVNGPACPANVLTILALQDMG